MSPKRDNLNAETFPTLKIILLFTLTVLFVIPPHPISYHTTTNITMNTALVLISCFLAAFSGVQATYNATTPSTLLDCGPRVNVLDENARAGVEVKCQLRARPSSPVTVTFNPGAFAAMSVCGLTFTPDNFNVAQAVRIFPGQGVDTTTDRTSFSHPIQWTLSSNDGGFNQVQSSLPIQRVFTKAARCASFSDPHINTFDGASYNNRVLGWNTLVDNERTTIQALHGLVSLRGRNGSQLTPDVENVTLKVA